MMDMTPWAKPGDPMERVQQALRDAGSVQSNDNHEMWQCPAHDDDTQSLHVNHGDFKYVTMHCYASCEHGAVLNALALSQDDFDGVTRARYNYRDADGALVYAIKRVDQWIPGESKHLGEPGTRDRVKKTLSASHVGADGKLTSGLPKSVKRVLYNLPAVLATAWEGKDVWLVEGEKAADIGTAYAASTGAPLTFTTAHGGSARPPTVSMVEAFANGNGARVTIMRDLDVASIKWALAWHQALVARGLVVRIVRPATTDDHDDLEQHLAAGFRLKNDVIAESVVALETIVGSDIAGVPSDDSEVRAPTPRSTEDVWPSPAMPQLVSEAFMARNCLSSVEDRPGSGRRTVTTMFHWRTSWYVFRHDDGYWRKVSDLWVKRELATALRHAQFDKEGELFDWPVTPQRLRDVMQMMETGLMLENETELDSWVIADHGPGGREPTELEETGRWVACANGLLEINSRQMRPWTPEFFGARKLPYAYKTWDAAERARVLRPWVDFLESLWERGAPEIDLLQEWFGYVIAGDVSLQKMLMLIGPPRSGKGVIERVLLDLVGKDNHTGITLTQIGSQYGMSSLIGKTIGIIGDARFAGRLNEQNVAVERLLNITGGNEIQAEQKYKDPWIGRIGARIMIVSNELPELAEASGALVARFEILTTSKSWLGREDVNLANRLCEPELLGAILDWSLDGYAHLKSAGRFTKPPSGERERRDLRSLINPTGEFAKSRLERTGSAEDYASKQDVFDAWRDWCAETGAPVGSLEGLGKRLRAGGFTKDTKQVRVLKTDRKINAWSGVRLLKNVRSA